MAEFATLARPYANAVFDLAVEADNFDDWSNDLNFLTTVIEDTTMTAVIANPQVDKNTLTRLLLDVCEEPLSKLGVNLLKILLENKRLNTIPQIALQFEQLKAQHQGMRKVEITAPYPVEPQQQQEIETALKRRLGKTVDVDITLDKSLLGGCLIRTGDEVIDVSMKGHLQRLATELRR
ncbi:MAG: F0F1 ATP synthase subunit delta [Thiomargarita sp.]|nr:F0F1 ATP synthase subunit delta [Thiomargarita sp.]